MQLFYIPEDTPITLDGLDEVITILENRLEDLDAIVQETEKHSPIPAKQERRKVQSVAKKIVLRRDKHQK